MNMRKDVSGIVIEPVFLRSILVAVDLEASTMAGERTGYSIVWHEVQVDAVVYGKRDKACAVALHSFHLMFWFGLLAHNVFALVYFFTNRWTD